MIMIQRSLGQNPISKSLSFKSWFENGDRFTQVYVVSFLLGVLFFWGGGALLGGGSCVIGPTALSMWYVLGPYLCGLLASIVVLAESCLENGTYSVMADAFLDSWDKLRTYSGRTHVAVISFHVVYFLFIFALAQVRSSIGL